MDATSFLTVEELAALARVHRATARRWVAAGRVGGTRIGNRYLVPVAGLAQLLEANARPPRNPPTRRRAR